MPVTQAWREVESDVHQPARWLLLVGGAFFLAIGAFGFLVIVPPGFPVWIVRLGAGLFTAFACFVFAWTIRQKFWPAQVWHAAADVLPNVPQEPMTLEGSVVHGRLTHELAEDRHGWQFRPAAKLWRSDKVFLFGFGIPFLVLFACVVTWSMRNQFNVDGWPAAALLGTTITLFCGGTVFVLVGMVMRAGYRRLARLHIPQYGGHVELDVPEDFGFEQMDLATGMQWMFVGDTARQQLSIPRELIAAVQLCPWKFVVKSLGEQTITWAVQGLLVLASAENSEYHRLPILLTSDFAGAAHLMRRLAGTLSVPFLFCADAEGWKAEAIRAKQREPLRCGGTLS